MLFIKYFFWCFILVIYPAIAEENRLHLDKEGKYQNLLIHISDKISEYDGKLLLSIKERITSASKVLHKATDAMDEYVPGVQFGNVYISVPYDWNITADPLTWQQAERANIKIVVKDDNDDSNKPFTKQSDRCGGEGQFIRFPEKYFLYNSTKNLKLLRYGKEIVREFAKFRFGVFSEEPINGLLTVYNGTHFLNSTCNQNIKWQINKPPERCSDKNTKCKYKIIKDQTHNYSLMFDIDTPSSEFFCNDKDKPHNREAENLHNIKCAYKSVTSVILRHRDFKERSGYPKTVVAEPVFHIVKQNGRKIVFVIDISGSMYKEINSIKEAVSTAINNWLEFGTEVGIVTYNNIARLIFPLTKIKNNEDRNALITQVNKTFCFGTTITSRGLLEGIQILLTKSNPKESPFGMIVLITDGEEDESDRLVVDELIRPYQTNVVINIIFTKKEKSSKLVKLAKKTGGKILFAKTNLLFLPMLKQIVLKGYYKNRKKNTSKTKKKEKNKDFKLKSKNRKLKITTKFRKLKYKYEDQYDGNDTLITLTFQDKILKYLMTLEDSTGKIFNNESVTGNNKEARITFRIPGLADGKYLLSVTRKPKQYFTRYTQLHSVKFSLSASAQEESYRIVNPVGEISQNLMEQVNENSSISVTVDLSNCGITKTEEVSVQLEIESPKRKLIKRMTDDGLGDDSIAGDKIYSFKIYSKYLGASGFYTFRGMVKITNTQTLESIDRVVVFENLFVKNVHQSAFNDKVPPAQMEDPTIRILNHKKRLIEVASIAPGDDSMDGDIRKYEILIRSTTDHVIKVKKQAAPYELIKIIVDLKSLETENSFLVAIRGEDEKQNVGKWSRMTPVKLSVSSSED